MEPDSDEEITVEPSLDAPFNADEAAVLLGLSEKQRRFADAILMGANQTQAARAAGYSGTDSSLRSTASDVAKSPRVQSYIQWAKNNRAGLPNDPATLEEVERRLSELLRGKDASASIRAAEVLNRLHMAKREAERERPRDPIAGLNDLARVSEFGLLCAMALAKANNVSWQPPVPPKPGLEEAAVAALKASMTPAERQKAEYILARQNSLPARGPELEGQAAPSPPAPAGDGAAVSSANGFYGDKHLAAMAFRGSKT